ncbi:AN1-type zinc finger protein 4-like [Ostrinia furnacalis]|uniref:AN1-type zinc finger protein 4-like n=1 Tax=Ostrinia furnacalis TaxID=93504 RepID=UPI00103B046C|nr:AN1-type zinc finger protein 4-like [Ostrinia furnacalis]
MSQHGCPERLSNRSKGFQEDGPSQPTMEVLVETLTGTAFEMTVSPTDTIFAIKSKIFRVEGIPVSQQHLLYNLKELDNASMLREHGVGDGARLRLVLGMCGGPITTRRLPPPAGAEPWRDIERLLDTTREETEWGSNGCKVTVLVFREGERVNMLRVRENRDGSYSPLDHNKYSSSLTHLLEHEPDDGLSGSLHENAVTMGKMMDLRRRMEDLSVQRRRSDRADKPEIQKTRSEETLAGARCERPRAFEDDACRYRLHYHCALNDRYSVLPGIGVRSESEQSIHDAAALLLPGADRAPATAPQDLGPLVGAGTSGWRAAGFGSAGSVGAVLRAREPDALHHALSSSSEQLQRTRILPSLSRHRNREHLHLSDEGLHLAPARSLEVGSERRQRRIQRISEAVCLTRSRVNLLRPKSYRKSSHRDRRIVIIVTTSASEPDTVIAS